MKLVAHAALKMLCLYGIRVRLPFSVQNASVVKLGVHAGFKPQWSGMTVRVRVPPDVQKIIKWKQKNTDKYGHLEVCVEGDQYDPTISKIVEQYIEYCKSK